MRKFYEKQELFEVIRSFKHPSIDSSVYTFLEIKTYVLSDINIERYFILAKKNNIRCIIPSFSDKLSPSEKMFDYLGELYPLLIKFSKIYGVKVGIHLQSLMERCYFLDSHPHDDTIRAKMLTRIDYFYDKGERVRKNIDPHVISITAYDEEYQESHHLTDTVKDGILDCEMTDNHLMLHEYMCDVYDAECGTTSCSVNKLSYDAYSKYLDIILDALGDEVRTALGKEIIFIYASELCFDTPNRRDWDEGINLEFFKSYGTGAAQFYDALFESIGENTSNIKNCFFTVRARMFKEGVLLAIRNFAEKYSIDYSYSLCESKMPASSWLFGDGMKNMEYSSCALLDKAYLYGLNSLHLASSAATQYGNQNIYCDIYKNYHQISKATFYDDALNAFSQGVTRFLTHFPVIKSNPSKNMRRKKRINKKQTLNFTNFAMRSQNLLEGGIRVCDIAVLYPIESIHAGVNLYQKRENKFEYPPSQLQNDYMTLVNILNVNCAQNSILLHPDQLKECTVRNRKLALDSQSIEFKMLFIPGSVIMSLEVMQKIKEFYNEGGKIVSTVALPKFASEYIFEDSGEVDEFAFMREYGNDNDIALRECIRHVFGDDAVNSNMIRAYFKHKNVRGGVAYHICPSKTAADGSLYVDPAIIKGIVHSTNTPLDVYMSNLPAVMNTNGFNTTYPEFTGLGMNKFIPYGGIINHLHKKHGNIDVYFFSNTTHEKYSGVAYLRGKMKPRFYNPFTGRVKYLPYRHINHKGYVYTAITLGLNHGDAVFIVTKTYYEIASPDNGYPFVDSID